MQASQTPSEQLRPGQHIPSVSPPHWPPCSRQSSWQEPSEPHSMRSSQQGSSSLHGGPPASEPDVHSHDVGWFWQPALASQKSTVQGSPSSQTIGAATQEPSAELQASTVHAFPSSQATAECWHWLAAHASIVQEF